MKKKYFLLLFITLFSLKISSQKSEEVVHISNLKNLPQEKIYAHINSNFLLTGEQLQYKIYCISERNNVLSTLSKIAYVELINSENKSILKQKIRLENGIGFSDFFIPASVKTNTYKFIAYTQWMRNKQLFFEENVYIINPFSGRLINSDSIVSNGISVERKQISSNIFDLKTDKRSYNKREKVVINYKPASSQIEGRFSISVRKFDTIQIPSKTNINVFSKNSNTANFNTEKIHLPELRGELIKGKIISKETNFSTSNIKIGLSLLGKNNFIKTAITNNKGEFYFTIDKPYDTAKAIFQVLNENRNKYTLEIIHDHTLEKTFTNFPEIKLTERIRKLIKKRSVHIQIENAYTTVKQDTYKPTKQNIPVFSKNVVRFVLDDYTRFKTINELAVEILEDVWLDKKNNSYTFHVRDNNLNTNTDLETLLIVDGYLVYDHNDFIDFDARKIKHVDVVKEKYVFGSQLYQGIIKVETFDNDYKPYSDHIKEVNLLKPSDTKSYYHPDYSANTNKHIPDYRTQLLWAPELSTKTDTISFFTSDITGMFELIIEGFTKDGKPIYERNYFTVK